MQVRRVRIFVASPGDVTPEREVAARVIAELNSTLGDQMNVAIEAVMWETHAWPGFGADAQEVINRQISTYDIFLGIMWKRLGTPTARAASGTVEEYERAMERWKEHGAPHLMFYFSQATVSPTPREVEQLPAVFNFKRMLSTHGGLYWEYEGLQDFERQLRQHLFRQISTSLAESTSVVPATERSGAFDVPSLPGVVARRDLRDELNSLCANHPVVAIEGLPGSGKTFLAADLVRSSDTSDSALW
jgi:hypothetical protein